MQNRKLAAEVRELGLSHIKRILSKPIVEMDKGEYDIFNQMLLRIAQAVLPRITEVTGEDGEPIRIDNATQNAVNEELMKFIGKSHGSPASPTVAPQTGATANTTPNGNPPNTATPGVQQPAGGAAPVPVSGK